MSRISAVLNRLMASDPALSRVKMGARVTLTILVSILFLIGIHLALVPLPPISYALAIVLSIEGGVAVRDRTPSEQARTRLMGCAASLLCITLAAMLEDYRIAADLAFLCVILAASLARVYGQRGFAVGMFAFISYFIGAYLKPSLAELPLAALGPLFAVAFGHLIRTYLLPDDWRRDLGEALKVIQHRVDDILQRLSSLSGTGAMTEKDREDLHHQEEQLKDVVLMAEGLLPRAPEGADPSEDEPVRALSIAIFDIHLAAESVIVTSTEALAPRSLVNSVMRGDTAQANEIAEIYGRQGHDERVAQSVKALLWLQRASSTLRKTIGDGALRRLIEADGAGTAKGQPKPDFSWGNPLVRAAVQITIASGIAMIFGLLLSRERWFWAVLTAFLVFNNTRSRGDAAIRAMQRSVGTLLGIVIGLAAATLLAGHTAATVVLASAGVFLAFYYLQVSYAVMSFFVTIVLCLVYGLIGQLTLEVLLLRVEETVIGAVAGIFVAFVIFPSSTRSTVELALARWYDSLAQLLDAVRAGEGRYKLVELANALDTAYRDLTVAARPLGSAWSLVTRPGPIRQTLAVFLAASYWARVFARDFADAKDPADPAILKAVDEAKTALDMAAARGADCFSAKRPRHTASSAANLPEARESVALGADMVANLLNRLYPSGPEAGKKQ
jgi:uncharacterized membrane protein YccC